MLYVPPPVTGTVYLVGAGPGDPDLLTVRAARLIGQAALVVHDGLVDQAILDLAPADARFISVAKSRARHIMSQEAINELLVNEALAGNDVIRLKGGDPFIFGRGGEEMQACKAAGVPVEIVPGISAAIGCAAQAQIPLTHRHAASAVTFIAGQCKGLTDQDWTGLFGPERTLVIYMGVASAAQIVERLIADGADGETPVAIIEKGTRQDARVIVTILADMADAVARDRVQSPALLIVGEVARQARDPRVQAQFEDMLEVQA